ncbi:hypothetical protein D9D35_00015 [Escherichia coli]|nr:hypothetical protein [Escherichia coli]EEW2060192.1 hypothetical protein [Escherichia coli]EEW3407725.1 hypothetical protein [Escherichia coli]EEX2493443.1 hypothetical protein [Escherichia coli]EFL3074870.1 hypothetical protein [Escherichia coli]
MDNITGNLLFAALLSCTQTSHKWLLRIDFNQQHLSVKIINNIEHAKTASTGQRITYKSADQL